MFFKIKEERFKMAAVSRYINSGHSSSTGKYYLTMWFGGKDKLFAFDTQQELEDVVTYLDTIFKVRPI